jgi:hypothetical protein
MGITDKALKIPHTTGVRAPWFEGVYTISSVEEVFSDVSYASSTVNCFDLNNGTNDVQIKDTSSLPAGMISLTWCYPRDNILVSNAKIEQMIS